MAALIVSTLALVLGFANYRRQKPPRGPGGLRFDVGYSWSPTSIMWAFSKQLDQEDGLILETAGVARGQTNQDQLEALLASRDGVKIATDSRGDLRPHSELRFIAIGQNTTPVIITGMRANVVRREQPLSETLVFGPPQGEGSNIQVGFNLDSHNPIACSLDDEMFLDGPYFSPNHVSVNLHEHVVFTIRAFTDEYYAEWEVLVEALVDGKSKTFSVRDGDRPFRTTAFADSYNTIFDFDFTAGRFIRLPPGYRFSDLAK